MTTVRSVLLAIALPAALAAQQPAGDVANPITTALRGRITPLQHNIAQAFDSIPESKFGYKPTPAQLTFGYIAQHVASDNYLFCRSFGSLAANIPADEASTPDSVKATWPKAKLVEQLKASNDYCDKAMEQLTDANLAEQTTIDFGGGRTRPAGRAAMALGHALDLEDHYSQLSNYMRLNGLIPPTALPRPGRGRGGNDQ